MTHWYGAIGRTNRDFISILEHLQQFVKLTWYPSNFGKNKKNWPPTDINELDKNRNLAKVTFPRGNIHTISPRVGW
jgi:hypothetical protein